MPKRKHAARRRPSSISKRPARRAMGEPQPRPFPTWRWRTFPVFFAFIIGLLAASFINGTPNNDAAATVQVISLLGLGYGLAHLFVVNVIVARRVKRRREAAERGETPEEDFEDELVYPDEEHTPPRR